MKNIILAAVAAVSLAATSAFAGQTYVEGAVGSTQGKNLAESATVGYSWSRSVSTELTYDHVAGTTDRNALMANAVVSPVRLPLVHPYVFGGVGVGFDGLGEVSADLQKVGSTRTVWDAGVGTLLPVTHDLAFDGRYTHIDFFNGRGRAADLLSVGVRYTF